jgi:protein involved in polysaccharide export with SLBB domain
MNSWLDPSQVGNFSRESTLEIRTSLSIQDSPVGIPGATDPKPDDLIPIYEEYRFEVGDALNVRVFELIARNTETAAQVFIDELGTIEMPVLGRLRVAGMTRTEIADEIRRLVVEKGYVQEPTVLVDPLVRRGQTYVIFGVTAAPNMYPIPGPDSRLLEVINMSGGLFDSVTDIYVMRKEKAAISDEFDARVRRGEGRMLASAARWTMSDALAAGHGGRWRQPPDEQAPDEQPPDEQDDERDRARREAEDELLDAVRRPEQDPSPSPEKPAEPAPAEPDDDLLRGRAPQQPRWIFLNGEWIESTEAPPPITPGEPPQPAPPRATPNGPAPELDWTRLVGDEEVRVIHVSAQALRDGDPRQNIVVRGGDMIRITAGQVGEYYMAGQVFRPGAYSLTGRQITLKTAIASAGNLAPLAWPDRCTIYRRYGEREEMHQVNLGAIFAGKEPDVLLKSNDLVLVGTHPIAPFLAVVRNAFRLTYGFGFVYDRNFADIDQFGPRINPDNLRGSGVGERFPNIFR